MGLRKLVRGSVYRGFVISRFFSIHYTITELKNIVRLYTEDFVTGSTVCFLPFPTAQLHGNWKLGDTVDLISGFRVSVNCGVHFEITPMCDVSPTSSKGNRNLLHFISGILR